MPLELQSKLLRVLQEREVQRLGRSETIKLDVRVVAATNCDLPDRVERGEFREDLVLPAQRGAAKNAALRARRGDVPLLRVTLSEICRAEGLPLKQFAAEAEDRLADIRGRATCGNWRTPSKQRWR